MCAMISRIKSCSSADNFLVPESLFDSICVCWPAFRITFNRPAKAERKSYINECCYWVKLATTWKAWKFCWYNAGTKCLKVNEKKSEYRLFLKNDPGLFDTIHEMEFTADSCSLAHVLNASINLQTPGLKSVTWKISGLVFSYNLQHYLYDTIAGYLLPICYMQFAHHLWNLCVCKV